MQVGNALYKSQCERARRGQLRTHRRCPAGGPCRTGSAALRDVRRRAAAGQGPDVVGLCLSIPVLAIAQHRAAFAGSTLRSTAPYALWTGRRSVLATLSVALCGMAHRLRRSLTAPAPGTCARSLLVLPLAVAAVAHAGPLGRWFVPCRTAAWTLGWALPVGIVTFRLWRRRPFLGPALAWLIACVVLVWRLVRGLAGSRGQVSSRPAAARRAPYPWSPPAAGPARRRATGGQPAGAGRAARPPGAAAAAAAAGGPGRRRAAQPGQAPSRRPGSRRRPTGRSSPSTRRWPSWTP